MESKKVRLITSALLGAVILILNVIQAAGSAPTTTISEAEVRQVVVDYLKSRINGIDVELNVRKINYKGALVLPKGKVSFEVMAPRQWEGWGNGNLALIVRVDDRVEKNIPINVEVEALASMLVTVRPLERGEVITAADVTMQKRDMAGVAGRICCSADEVVGKRVRNSLRANVPLRSDAVEKVPIIKSGQMVTILLENPVMRITATGQAKEAGAEGDTVMVRNLSSKQYVPATVIDGSTVKVEF